MSAAICADDACGWPVPGYRFAHPGYARTMLGWRGASAAVGRYDAALRELAAARRRSCDVLVTLVEAWEAKHYALDLPDPVEAIKYHMDQKGLVARDLVPFIGSRNRVYEVLSRKRPLTLTMIQRLHDGLGIPAESLIKVRRRRAA